MTGFLIYVCEVLSMFWYIVACIGSFALGFFLCAILTAGKIADLENELIREKNVWKVLKMEEANNND